MLIRTLIADAFETKCRVISADGSKECVVVDPGMGVARTLPEIIDASDRQVVAVLLTHGHLDHTYAAADVCSRYDVPCYIHPADREMLEDPMPWLGPEFGPQFEAALPRGWQWASPHAVQELAAGAVLNMAGIHFRVEHTPGHTPGSVMYAFSHEGSKYCLVGDVLYAGSIGRTDMPGGDRAQTLASLRGVLEKDDDTVLLTGHGADTTVGAERRSNPFMVQAAQKP